MRSRTGQLANWARNAATIEGRIATFCEPYDVAESYNDKKSVFETLDQGKHCQIADFCPASALLRAQLRAPIQNELHVVVA